MSDLETQRLKLLAELEKLDALLGQHRLVINGERLKPREYMVWRGGVLKQRVELLAQYRELKLQIKNERTM